MYTGGSYAPWVAVALAVICLIALGLVLAAATDHLRMRDAAVAKKAAMAPNPNSEHLCEGCQGIRFEFEMGWSADALWRCYRCRGMASPTPAGWYPERGLPGALRYWDGNYWTDHRK
ncbi:DUF2510 domain-containing protein [Mycolicibacterium frederiksbergense]|uniref:DUF2510 domain-containing protein n=1 Tax=Mycolicibacterium frederiksbergense TaxID=117567 RepID=UPI003557A21C